MIVSIDKQHGYELAYIKLSEDPVTSTAKVTDDFIVDLNSEGKVVGIEILNAEDYDLESLSVRDLNKIYS